MRINSLLFKASLILLAIVVAGAAVLTYEVLMEAYGPGPPYYARTTNMDKWTSPWPALAPLWALVVLVALSVGGLAVARSRGKKSRAEE